MRGEFIDTGRERLYYYAAGSRGAGDPIVLVHGFPTSSHLWMRLVPLVPAGHRVVVPDLLGFGRSDPQTVAPDPVAQFGIEAHAERLARLFAALNIGRACLVAHGLGAAIATTFAGSDTEHVSGLCLVNPLVPPAWPLTERALLRISLPILQLLPQRLALRSIRSRLRSAYADRRRFEHSIDQYLRPFTGPGGGRRLVAHLRALTVPPTPREAISVHPARKAWPRTVILAGRLDRVAPPSAVARLAAAIPGSDLEPVDGGHFAPEESPEQVAVALVKLFAT